MDALDMLKRSHMRIRQLLDRWQAVQEVSNRRRNRILTALARELALHERREEEVLYPQLNAEDETRPLALEGYQEHQLTDWILEDLRSHDATDPTWLARFNLMKDVLSMHVREQEEAVFARAREVLDQRRLQEMGERMAAIRSGQG